MTKLDYAYCSETGLARGHNEDAVLALSRENAGLFLVADGVGGRANGEVVSQYIRDGYEQWWRTKFLPSYESTDFQKALDDIQKILLKMNRELVQRFGEMNAGSTLALLFLRGEKFACIWAGDSRIYRFRGFSAKQITRDDVYRAAGEADRKQDGKLISAVGIRTTLEFNAYTDTVRNHDRFFLCSDGVYRYISPAKLRRRVFWDGSFAAPAQVTDQIGREVLRNGAGDNYTMIFLKVRN